MKERWADVGRERRGGLWLFRRSEAEEQMAVPQIRGGRRDANGAGVRPMVPERRVTKQSQNVEARRLESLGWTVGREVWCQLE